MDVICWLCNL